MQEEHAGMFLGREAEAGLGFEMSQGEEIGEGRKGNTERGWEDRD